MFFFVLFVNIILYIYTVYIIYKTGKNIFTVLTASLQFLVQEVLIAAQFTQTINRLLIDC